MRKRTHEIPRNDRDILGDNNSNNAFDSSSVAANADGSLIERLEYIQVAVGGAAGQLRFQQSESTTVEDNAFQQFSISLIDINSGAITSVNINIAAISVEMAKSTAGGAFSAVGITQPTFAKADGRVYTSYQFLDAEWAVGDVYRLTVSDIVVTFGAEFAYVPMMVWSNMVTDIIDIDTVVDSIKVDTGRIQDTAITIGMGSGSLASYIAGNNGGLGTALPVSTSLYDTTKNIRNVPIDGTTLPVANTLSDILHKDGSYTYDNTTDSLEAISDKITAIPANTGVGVRQVLVKSITSAANAGATTLAQVGTNPVVIESICVQADTASQTDLTSAAVYGGSANAITFINATDAAKANLDAVDETVSWTGACRLAVAKNIVMDLQGTGTTAVDLTVTITYYAEVAGGVLS